MPQTIVITVINADVLLALQSLPAKSVQVVITSPPYLWLRQYFFHGAVTIKHNLTPEQKAYVLSELIKNKVVPKYGGKNK